MRVITKHGYSLGGVTEARLVRYPHSGKNPASEVILLFQGNRLSEIISSWQLARIEP